MSEQLLDDKHNRYLVFLQEDGSDYVLLLPIFLLVNANGSVLLVKSV